MTVENGHTKEMLQPLTRELAEFAALTDYQAMPVELVRWLRYDVLDSVAVGLFGSTLPWITPATELWEELGGAPQATVWGRNSRLPLPITVRANSHAQNSFEYDDTYVWSGLGIHPGNSVVTSALATAELLGAVSGREFMAAVVVGHEVAVRVRLGITTPRRGLNHTAICSTFGAAATTGRLLGLNVEQMTWALGSAGAYVGGLLTYPPRSMVKRMVNARAAEGGAMAALLANRGFTGIDNVLESDVGGFYATYSNGFDLTKVTEDLGSTYYSLNVQPKRYPMITTAHAAIEAACELVAEHNFDGYDIAQVTVRTNSRSQLMTTGFEPDTITSAQMSMPFGVATALCTGAVHPEALSGYSLEDPKIRHVLSKIQPVKEPEFDAIKMAAGGPAQVEVRLQGGHVLQSSVVPEISRMSEEEIEQKAHHAVQVVAGKERADQLVSAFRELEQRASVNDLFPILSRA